MLSPTSRDFNKSLLDFFNPVDLQLILMLMCESLNLIISGNHCWAVKLKAIMKRSEVESSLSSSLTVLHAWCASALSYWKQKLSLATCLIAVNICWDSVLKYLTDIVRWLSVLAEKNSHGARYHGRHGERRLCAYQTGGCFVPCVGAYSLVHTVDRFMNER